MGLPAVEQHGLPQLARQGELGRGAPAAGRRGGRGCGSSRARSPRSRPPAGARARLAIAASTSSPAVAASWGWMPTAAYTSGWPRPASRRRGGRRVGAYGQDAGDPGRAGPREHRARSAAKAGSCRCAWVSKSGGPSRHDGEAHPPDQLPRAGHDVHRPAARRIGPEVGLPRVGAKAGAAAAEHRGRQRTRDQPAPATPLVDDRLAKARRGRHRRVGHQPAPRGQRAGGRRRPQAPPARDSRRRARSSAAPDGAAPAEPPASEHPRTPRRPRPGRGPGGARPPAGPVTQAGDSDRPPRTALAATARAGATPTRGKATFSPANMRRRRAAAPSPGPRGRRRVPRVHAS